VFFGRVRLWFDSPPEIIGMNRIYFPNINFLRALAAILVLVYHVIELTEWKSFPVKGPLLSFRLGWLGVDLFFVISGFVIGLSAIKLYRDSQDNYHKTFVRRRLARIAPLYFFTAILFLALLAPDLWKMKTKELLAHIGAHAAFVHNWFYKTHGSINGPNWSVAAEMQFYLLALLLCPVLSKVKPWKILFWGIVIAWISRFAAFWWTMERGNTYRTFIFSSQVPGMADEFAFGIFLARLFLDGTLRSWAGKWERSRLLAIAGILFAGLVVWFWGMSIFWKNSHYWTNVFMVTFWRTTVAMSFASLVALLCLLPDLTRHWFSKPLHYLGEISYGLYLWHLIVILSLKKLVAPENPILFLNLSLGLTFILAVLSWHLLEKPMAKRFR
jgi:peptidoglycan/LPS O-acetylase OafA/YrhL